MMKKSYRNKIFAYIAILGLVFPSSLVFASYIDRQNNSFALDFHPDMPPDAVSKDCGAANNNSGSFVCAELPLDSTIIGWFGKFKGLATSSVSDIVVSCGEGVRDYYLEDYTDAIYSVAEQIHCGDTPNLNGNSDLSAFVDGVNGDEYGELTVYYVPRDTRKGEPTSGLGSVIFGIAVLIFLQSMVFMGLLFKDKHNV